MRVRVPWCVVNGGTERLRSIGLFNGISENVNEICLMPSHKKILLLLLGIESFDFMFWGWLKFFEGKCARGDPAP